MTHVGQHVAEGGRAARHLQSDVEPFAHAELLLHLGEVPLAHVDGHRHAQLFGQFQAVRVEFRDHRESRPGVPRHGGGHDADGTRAGDQHVLAQHREAERGVHRVAEGVEDGGHVEIDSFVMTPDIGHRQRNVLGESPRAVDADPHAVGAQVAPPGETIAAAAADHVAFPADHVPGKEIGDIGAHRFNPADEFVADRHGHGDGLLRPLVPLVDVDVGAADAGP